MRALALLACCGCVSFAAPPPLITLGGPRLAPEAGTQLGIGSRHQRGPLSRRAFGGDAWFGRFRYGLGSADVGADVMGLRRADDKGTFTGKLALRARVRRWLSAEAGLGAADDSDGKSLGGDRGSTWDAYGALRAAGSVAVTNQNVNGKPGAQDAAFALASAGATARVSDAIRLRFRGRRRPDGSPEHPRLRHRHPLWRRPSSSIFIEDFQVRLTLRPTTC